ncbi:bifunctional DNA-formamidopyrimidine glycosylase/DNA-(apurinic or apyrimidinic site) lyase [uncultured Cocleimonas sp.]|uniref:bifunctional DNA-formamidopyrimidine glycosylase/DNA-(apurinic or apyrimidinic site) lyase n=1 Tax=uncultured Cocleimonas sp. TaxID=1051587 RepID=UPI0026247BEE|nr:bifunctional DNA-formamidopyrimidine glycosylase/DNA-(apurinic or apyrimidinic site) lyase [uncultured Cocleimonas sp.]
MPELPEVETTRKGIKPYTHQQTVAKVVVRQPKLRWPVPTDIAQMEGQLIESVRRRGKYILLETSAGTAIIHLGMSGSLRIVDDGLEPEKHDHVDFIMDTGKTVRLHDPRRFGAVLWTQQNPLKHKLIRSLGPEPLSDDFNADYLYEVSRGRSMSIKQFIMNGHVVVGVGNIYACESLFMSGISPKWQAGKVSKARYQKLVEQIKIVLAKAIAQGGTTLKDFVQVEGKPGYFKQELNAYGRAGERCNNCESTIKQITQGQRSTFYCGKCQR